jgi:hypothetical protein
MTPVRYEHEVFKEMTEVDQHSSKAFRTRLSCRIRKAVSDGSLINVPVNLWT